MVLNGNRVLSYFIMLAFLFCAQSCEKEFFIVVNCSQCTTEEPASAEITIKIRESLLDIGNVRLNVYEGDDTSSPLIYSYILSWNNLSVDVALNRTYTFEAIYLVDSKIYRALDSVRPAVKHSKEECDEPCYYVYNNVANLKLKYL